MKITISGSMKFSKKMREVAHFLEGNGHFVYLPSDTKMYLDAAHDVLSNKKRRSTKKD